MSRRFLFPPWTGAAVALILLAGWTAWRQPAFLRPVNLINIADQQSMVGIITVGMTLVIILGGIDLSVGSLVALSGGLGILALNKAAQHHGDSTAVICACAVTILIGLAAGLLNGILVAKGRIAPFIATLGGLAAYRSLATWLANGGQFRAVDSPWFAMLGQGIAIPHTNISRLPRRVVPMQFPYAIMVWFAVAIIGWILLNRMKIGRYIIALGSNERAAYYSAISIDRVKMITYALLGLATGIAGLMWAAYYQSVNSGNAGSLMELEAIAACVIGGTRMEGGSGSIAGAVIGVLLLGVIRNMMVMLEINSQLQGVVFGVIIIAAVLVQRRPVNR